MVQKFNAAYDQYYNKGATRTSVEITTSFFHLASGGLGCCKKKKGAGSWQALIVAFRIECRSSTWTMKWRN
ncbi:uncharacterized protein isoform X2 [Bombus fervidus]|uniref:uncharacterized protein isoform X2 n=1 Tax=Bombus fervidus TaxID=203811 RepID=UPI003D18A443